MPIPRAFYTTLLILPSYYSVWFTVLPAYHAVVHSPHSRSSPLCRSPLPHDLIPRAAFGWHKFVRAVCRTGAGAAVRWPSVSLRLWQRDRGDGAITAGSTM